MLNDDPAALSSGAAARPDPTLPAAPATSPDAAAPDAPAGSKTPSRRRLWIGLGVFAALFLAGAGGIYALVRNYNQPGVAATQFCHVLTTQSYDSAYAMLSTKFQALYTSTQFKADMQALDSAEGLVTDCKLASGNNVYDYGVGSDHATIVLATTRVHQGKLQGALHLVDQGDWKVDAIDTSLLGLSLGAVQTIDAYCAALQSQDYDALYDLLSSKLRATYNITQFRLAMQALDNVEGIATDCKLANGNNVYGYTTVVLDITRVHQGTLQGALHLVQQNDWKVDGIDTSLLGLNLGALHTIAAYCVALQSQNADTLYALLGENLRDQLPKTYYYAIASAQELYGQVTMCTIESIASGNTNTTTTVTMSLTWTRKGTITGQLTLDGTTGAWAISNISEELEGRDLLPVAATLQLCWSVSGGDFAGAYGLTSSAFQHGTTQAQFTQMFALPAGDRWEGCALDLMPSYRFTGTQAQLTVTFYHSGDLVPGKGEPSALLTVSLVKAGGVWTIDTIQLSPG